MRLNSTLRQVWIKSRQWHYFRAIFNCFRNDSWNVLVLCTAGLPTPSPISSIFVPAQVVYPNNPDYYYEWIPNGPTSAWIARSAGTSYQGPPGYAFWTTFDLTGFNISTAYLNGSFAIDNVGILSLNGVNLISWSSFKQFFTGISPIGKYFLPGVNKLAINMTESDQYGDAVRLAGTHWHNI